ncbi:MAG: DNA-processing protein DprA [Kosmotogaceae bacterium]
MHREEYALLALSGDLTVNEISKCIEKKITINDFMKNNLPFIPQAKQKRVFSNLKTTEKYLKTYKYIVFNDESYPELLRETDSPPPVLFYKGDINKTSDKMSLSMVGSRKSSAYGYNIALSFASQIVNYNFTVISGLAAGIDGASHRGALEGSGNTIAVLGCGIDKVYPASNRDLYRAISKRGCILSEYLPGTPPMKHNFPRRNRIIAGLSKAVLVVEATKKSGSLITARFALDNGRDVYAIPGDIRRKNSSGTNWLIQNGAKLISSVEDILEEYDVLRSISTEENYSENTLKIIKILENGPAHFDEILMATKLKYDEILNELTKLQLEGKAYENAGRWSLT